MRPDRIVVGEVRDAAALDMLQAMNTGHDGSICTVHANTPRDALARIETMVLMAGMDLPVRAIREQVASAIDLIVHQTPAQGRHPPHHPRHRGRAAWRATSSPCRTSSSSTTRPGFDENGKTLGRLSATGLRPKFLEKLAARQRARRPDAVRDGRSLIHAAPRLTGRRGARLGRCRRDGAPGRPDGRPRLRGRGQHRPRRDATDGKLQVLYSLSNVRRRHARPEDVERHPRRQARRRDGRPSRPTRSRPSAVPPSSRSTSATAWRPTASSPRPSAPHRSSSTPPRPTCTSASSPSPATVTVAQDPTLDRAATASVVEGLTLSRGTLLYDGVAQGRRAASGTEGQRSVIVLSDGRDTGDDQARRRRRRDQGRRGQGRRRRPGPVRGRRDAARAALRRRQRRRHQRQRPQGASARSSPTRPRPSPSRS